MAATPPPGYTPPPADLPQRGDRATFSNRVDAWVTWFSTVILTQLAAIVANAYANALDAAASATAAMGYRDTALTYRDAAQAARDLALTYRDAAQAARDTALTYRDQAAASATAAANSAASLTATSTTSIAVGAGAKVLTVPAGKQFPTGELLSIISAGTPTLRMFGTVASYVGTALTATITDFEGSGTAADWVIAPGGARGPTGGTAGGSLTAALNEKKGTDIASAATIDPWSSGGNIMALTGSVTITGIAPAPQAGARRTLIVKGAPTITSNAAIIVKGGTNLLAAGDEVDIEAETTTLFNVTIRRADGSATAVTLFRNAVFYESSTVWVAPRDGLVRFHVKGSDGSGGLAAGGGSTGRAAAASGGSGAGYAIRTVYVKAGDTFSLLTGVRAVGASGGTGTVANGNNGGATTVTGPGVSITCNGGLGGNATVVYGTGSVAPGTATALGVAGGSATGGDMNITGGASGTATATNTSLSNNTAGAATGGGTFGQRGTGQPSGNATATATSTGSAYAASGGAGIGGGSGAASTSNSTAAVTYSPTGGGGSVGPSSSNSAGNVGTVAGGLGQPLAVTQTPLTLNGAGTAGVATSTFSSLAATAPGAGSGAVIATGQNSALVAPSVTFAASGGFAGFVNSASISGGHADYGGGTGGVAGQSSASSWQSGDAGRAWVLIEHN